MQSYRLIIALLLVSGTVHAAPLLRTSVAGKQESDKSLKELQAGIETHAITLTDRSSGIVHHYRAFALHDILDASFGTRWRDDFYSDIAFTALDGYVAVTPISTLIQQGGYLAFEDLDVPEWAPIGKKKTDPSPLYLVWTQENQGPHNGYPWPYQMREMNLIRFEDQYPAVVPRNVKKDSAVDRGYRAFRRHCVQCHAISQEGGKRGPDLNAPQNILKYRSEEFLKKFIRQPSRYRYSQMPDHNSLSGKEIQDIIDYLRHKGREEQRDW